MNRIHKCSTSFLLSLILVLCTGKLHAQEYVVPLQGNPALGQSKSPGYIAHKPLPLSLPFFEDFSYGLSERYPRILLWTDSSVYINNTFAQNMHNRGIATFDALNRYGVPYDTLNAMAQVDADTLCSQEIDLSAMAPADSLYLSFEYAPKGLGFAPKPNDSLVVWAKGSVLGWARIKTILPDTNSTFSTAMIALTDPGYYHNEFQFRITNKATQGISGSHWQVDNVLLAAGRNSQDTIITDLAFTQNPSNLLKDFTAMPYKHFATDKAQFLAPNRSIYLYNGFGLPQNANIHYNTRYDAGYLLSSGTQAISIAGQSAHTTTLPGIAPTAITPAANVFKLISTYYFDSIAADRGRRNDTIWQVQDFNDYFAYDDGSAEQAYFLNLSPSAPGQIAVEYACYVPDTLAAVAIQFAPQLGHPENKEFYIKVYSEISLGSNAGTELYSQSLNFPYYSDSINGFALYPLHELVPLPVGQFYISLFFPSGGISDSVQIGLDVNRVGANHRYYNVESSWQSSTLEGALMLRPVMGSTIITGIANKEEEGALQLYPNPARKRVHISSPILGPYSVIDVLGKTWLRGTIGSKQYQLDVSSLNSGVYYLQIVSPHGEKLSKRLVVR